MNTRKSKSEFISEMNKRIDKRNELLDFYNNVFLPTLKKFDGKVYNIRLIKALREQTTDNSLWWITERSNSGEIEIRLRMGSFNYNDYESLWVKCLLNEDYRIDYEKSVGDYYAKSWLENFKKGIDEYQDTIDNYDKYMEIADKLENALKEYNKMPHKFRGHLDTDYMHIY